MSRRNPRGSSARKRREQDRSRAASRRAYRPLAGAFYKAAFDLGMHAGRTLNERIQLRLLTLAAQGRLPTFDYLGTPTGRRLDT